MTYEQLNIHIYSEYDTEVCHVATRSPRRSVSFALAAGGDTN